jgi:hypothetical protein
MARCTPIYRAEVVTIRVLDDPQWPCAGSRFRFGQDACARDLIGLCLRSQAQRIDQKRRDDQSADNSHGVEHHRRRNTVVGRLFATGSVNLALNTHYSQACALAPSPIPVQTQFAYPLGA